MAAHSQSFESIHSAMLDLTRNFAASTGIEAILASVTAAAVDLVEGVDYGRRDVGRGRQVPIDRALGTTGHRT